MPIPREKIVNRDLTAISIPVIDAAWVAANYTPEESRTPQQNEVLRLSSEFTRELLEADDYVLGVPVHNWGPPASFKLWVDQVVAPYGPKLLDKRVTFIVAGGRSQGVGSGVASRNYVEPWLRTLFGRFGVDDMRFIIVDGTADIRNGKTDLDTFLAPHIEAIHSLFVEDLAYST